MDVKRIATDELCQMKKTLTVELMHENKDGMNYFYAMLELPAKEHEIRDAYHKVRITGQDETYQEIYILESPMLPILSEKRLDSPTMDELNFFAKRLAALEEKELLVMRAVFSKAIRDEDDLISMKDLINCTYGLDSVPIAAGIGNDTELGKLVMESGMDQAIERLSEELWYLIDKAQVGKQQRENDGGVFFDGHYIAAGEYELPEKYDGVHLPESVTTKWYAFRLKVAAPPQNGAEDIACSPEWITLPVSRKEAELVARKQGVRRIEDCVYLEIDSAVPQIDEEQFGSMEEFYKLNSLAEKMAYMSPEDQVKFKAALGAESPADMDEILFLADNLSQYELSTSADDEASFFREYLLHYLDERFDRTWLDTLLSRKEGLHLLEKLGAAVTEYGVISARGHSLYELVPYCENETINQNTQSEAENMESENYALQMGGM